MKTKRAAVPIAALLCGCTTMAPPVQPAQQPKETSPSHRHPTPRPLKLMGGDRNVVTPIKTTAKEVEPCPEEMVLVRRPQAAYCIDRWEASLELAAEAGGKPWPGNRNIDGMESQVRAVSLLGRKPQGYISGKQAAMACAHSGKRLCEIDEWVRACKGPKGLLYPYGSERLPNRCNDRYRKLNYHPVVRLFKKLAPPGTDSKEMWLPSWMNRPELHELSHSVKPTGSHVACESAYGVFDMVGNLHEWVADPQGTFFGGFFMDTFQNGEGCEYRTIGHPFDYHDYSTGFRCCADARVSRQIVTSPQGL